MEDRRSIRLSIDDDQYNIGEYDFYIHSKIESITDKGKYYNENCGIYTNKKGKNTDDGSCIMVTDLKNSTHLWGDNQNNMKDQILLHNYILRSGINKLMCKLGNNKPHDIFKLNEIGDSWEIVINGPGRFIKMFWFIMFILKNYVVNNTNRPNIRIGVSSGNNIISNKTGSMIEWGKTELISNKVLHSDELRLGYEDYMKARALEQIAGKDEEDVGFKKDSSAVALSLCFFMGLLNELPGKNKSLIGSTFNWNIEKNMVNPETIDDISYIVEKELGSINEIIDESSKEFIKYRKFTTELVSGYIVFIKIKREIEEVFIKMVKKCMLKHPNSFPVIISIEGAGLIYNMYSKELTPIVNMIQCIHNFTDYVNLKKSKSMVKMSIINSDLNNTTIYNIRDCPTCWNTDKSIYAACSGSSKKDIDEYEIQQTFIRYISHTQNIAARTLFAKLAPTEPDKKWTTKFGRIYSNDPQTLKYLVIDGGGVKGESKLFKGLPDPNGNNNIFSISL